MAVRVLLYRKLCWCCSTYPWARRAALPGISRRENPRRRTCVVCNSHLCGHDAMQLRMRRYSGPKVVVLSVCPQFCFAGLREGGGRTALLMQMPNMATATAGTRTTFTPSASKSLCEPGVVEHDSYDMSLAHAVVAAMLAPLVCSCVSLLPL